MLVVVTLYDIHSMLCIVLRCFMVRVDEPHTHVQGRVRIRQVLFLGGQGLAGTLNGRKSPVPEAKVRTSPPKFNPSRPVEGGPQTPTLNNIHHPTRAISSCRMI
jgi:hypothetical protein